MKKRKRLKRWCLLASALGAYPAFVLLYTWSFVFSSEFEGGRHGPLDAYRHALASAVVSYTLGQPAVNLVTRLFESGGKDSNTMDRHNNRIGAGLGTRANSFTGIEPSVRQAVLNGTTGASEPDRITWLPKERWRDARMW